MEQGVALSSIVSPGVCEWFNVIAIHMCTIKNVDMKSPV